MAIDVRRADERFRTDLGWLHSRHSFNFGPHHEPIDTKHGLLVVNNDDWVAPGGGFGHHSHRDMEIVTWVLEGELRHSDSTGTEGVIRPGLAQRMSAGRGITHAEMNNSEVVGVHFVQMWVLPDETGVEPSYEQRDVTDQLDSATLFPIASGQGHEGAVSIHQKDAVLWGGRLEAGAEVDVPWAPHVHVFLAAGSGDLEGDGQTESLHSGDALRGTGPARLRLKAGAGGTEVLIWATA